MKAVEETAETTPSLIMQSLVYSISSTTDGVEQKIRIFGVLHTLLIADLGAVQGRNGNTTFDEHRLHE